MDFLSASYLASQLFSAISLCLGVRAFLHPKDDKLKLYIGAAGISTAIHFAFLGSWVGCTLALVGAARYISASYSKSPWLYYFFLFLGLGIGAYRFEGYADFLPIIAHVISCYVLFNAEGRTLRKSLLVITACWLVYNAINYSVVGSVLESFYFTTNAYNLWRTRNKSPQ